MNKLYTEFELKYAMDIARCQANLTFDEVLEQLTSIELPTDEEIHPNSPYESNSDWDIGYHNGWKQGAKWMRDKIQGGNNE